MRRCFLLWVMVFVLASGNAQPLKGITDIKLKNIRNRGVSVSVSSKNIVILFMGTDCPITQKYVARIKEIIKTFESTTTFYGVFPEQFSVKEIKRFKKDYNLSMLLLRDDKMKLVQYLEATVTPEVFLLDEQLNLQYKGAIDNWFYELGKYRLNTTEQYLIDALTALDKNKQPPWKQTKAIGCFIQMSHHMNHH